MNPHKIKAEKGDPPMYVLNAWREYEIETGEPMTRDEMAHVASMVLGYVYAEFFGGRPSMAEFVIKNTKHVSETQAKYLKSAMREFGE